MSSIVDVVGAFPSHASWTPELMKRYDMDSIVQTRNEQLMKGLPETREVVVRNISKRTTKSDVEAYLRNHLSDTNVVAWANAVNIDGSDPEEFDKAMVAKKWATRIWNNLFVVETPTDRQSIRLLDAYLPIVSIVPTGNRQLTRQDLINALLQVRAAMETPENAKRCKFTSLLKTLAVAETPDDVNDVYQKYIDKNGTCYSADEVAFKHLPNVCAAIFQANALQKVMDNFGIRVKYVERNHLNNYRRDTQVYALFCAVSALPAATTVEAAAKVSEKVSAEKVSAEKVSAEKVSEKVSAEKVSAEKVSAEKVSADKVSAEKPDEIGIDLVKKIMQAIKAELPA